MYERLTNTSLLAKPSAVWPLIAAIFAYQLGA
jgi:hypothetical protein